jgi:hypothetical protein
MTRLPFPELASFNSHSSVGGAGSAPVYEGYILTVPRYQVWK